MFIVTSPLFLVYGNYMGDVIFRTGMESAFLSELLLKCIQV